MKYKLVIHIGTPKTGTTAIQQFLCENYDMLQQFGWQYMDVQRGTDVKSNTNYADSAAVTMLGKVVDHTSGWRVNTEHAIWREMWEQIRKRLEDSNVILSEEMIWRWNLTSFFEACKKEYDHIEVIVYLRRQDRYIESWWNQEVKERPYRSETFSDYIKNGKDPSLSYLEKLNEIADVVGTGQLHVRVYEKQQFSGERGDVVSDFLAALSIYPDWEECAVRSSVNERLSGNLLEIKRNLNSILIREDAAAKQMQLAVRSIGAAYSTKASDRHIEGYFSTEERRKFLDCFAEENKKIAQKYLGSEKLFQDTDVDIPEYSVNWNMMYADMIHIFGELIYQQQKKLSAQAAVTMRMIQKSLSKEGRKLAIFGAGFGCRNLLAQCRLDADVIWDNDICKHGRTVLGIPIMALDQKHIRDYFVIISCEDERLTKQIAEQLEKLGCQKYEDYVAGNELL
ncbi:hypothetical protein IMSAGC012_01659 [Lachnospiraceae bacterium]|nr:hypothetical protein IMSAGC012_01659 [Lachnospiraceae bacterium]